MKKLEREQMKKVQGGLIAPGPGCYKCCRSNGVCSSCVTSYSGAKCPEDGTTLTGCGTDCGN